MACTQFAPGVVVCRPSDRFLRKVIQRCPTCECQTEMVARHEAWYGVTFYCCRCGDAWSDGERHMRPFARGWRKAAVKKHRKLWDRASHGPPPPVEELYPELAEGA